MSGLILKRAFASRPCGRWSDADYDVFADGAVVGRIFKANAASPGAGMKFRIILPRVAPTQHTRGY